MLLAGMVLATLTVILALVFFLKPYYLRAQAYDLNKLSDYKVASIFYDRKAAEIGRLFVEDRVLLKHDEIPETMRQAVVAMEDRRFYSHWGVDLKGVARAFYHNLRHWRCSQGGSTVTQQIAKHLIGRFERTFDRKLVEAFLALRIEYHYSKTEILDLYLNRIYFGKGYFGLEAAATGYFGKHARDLSVSECAALAAIIKAPNTYSLRKNIEAATKRRDYALMLMMEQGMLAPEVVGKALASPLRTIPEVPVRGQGYFMALAIKELRQLLDLGEEEDIPQGLTVQTTLDVGMQRAAESVARQQLNKLNPNRASGASPLGAEADELQTAILALEMQTGAVRVLVGGRDFDKSPFDRARMARRENGAVLQPLIYSLAYERLHLSPVSLINASYLDETAVKRDDKLGLGDPARDLGKPFLMIQDALALGNVSAAARVKTELGLDLVDQWLEGAGIARSSRDRPGLSTDLTLYELTSLYQMLGNAGSRIEPYCIESVRNHNDETLYQSKRGEGKALLDPLTAGQMTLSLESITRDGVGARLSSEFGVPAPVAGMNGFSSGYRDAWYVGFTPTLACGVWVGYDKSRPIEPRAAAVSSAVSIWGDVMGKISEKSAAPGGFPVPKGLGKVEVDRNTGEIQGQGFMTPGPGHAFVYLRPEQITVAQKREAAQQEPGSQGWTGWLSTLVSSATGTNSSPAPNRQDAPRDIPPLVTYRMPALRGDIVTGDGKVLATNTQSQDLVLPWPSIETAGNEEAALNWIHNRLGLAKEWLKRDLEVSEEELRSLYRFQRFHPVVVAQNLTATEVSDFPKSVLVQNGFALQGVPRRVYPEGTVLAHAVGYLQRSQARNSKAYMAGDVIYADYRGGAGLEGYFDSELRGQEGELTIETTPEGFTRKAIVVSPAVKGNTLRLTIDSRIQSAAEYALKEVKSGAAIVMDVHNGDILAMASRPSFNPNEFLPFLTSEKWQNFNQDPGKPLVDRVYRQYNPPGSIFKVVTTLAAMRAGVFDPAQTVRCPGYFDVGEMRYELPREVSSPVSFRTAISRSYNTYFFTIGLKAGRDALVEAARDWGIGQPTGFILPGELSGVMPDDAYVRKTHNRVMGPGDVTNASIGQGDVLVTPIQMASLMSAVANGGTLYRPHLVRQLEDRSGKPTKLFQPEIIRKIPIDPEQLKILTNGLVAATEEGTAQAARVAGVRVASKTGTAQVGAKSRPRQIAWLVGFLPANAPQYAFAVMVEGDWSEDLHGGEDAAPVAGRLFGQVYAGAASTLTQTNR